MQHVDAARLSQQLKAVCDPNRIQILSILVDGEFCVSALVTRLGIDQPKVSHHLAILRDAGIIRSRRDGRHINYSIWPNVHHRVTAETGPVDHFELGAITVAFQFTPEASLDAASADVEPVIPMVRPAVTSAARHAEPSGGMEASAEAGASGAIQPAN